MLHPLRRPLLAASLAFVTVFAAGCEHGSARNEANAQQELEAVAREMAATRIGAVALEDPDTAAQMRRRLGELVRRLESIQGAAPGQQASASLMAARLQADMGRIAADRLQELERQLRDDRARLVGAVIGAKALDAFASAAEQFSATEDQAELERLRGEAEQALAQLQRRVEQLSGPAEALKRESEERRAAARALDAQELALRQQAREAGASAGFRYIEQAAAIRDDANRLRIEAARNDIELMELTPELELAEVDAAQQTQVIAAVDQAAADLEAAARQAKEMASEARGRIAELREEIDLGLTAIESVENGPVAELAQMAQQDFEKAAQLAQRAASGSFATTARQTGASVRQALAELHWNRAMASRDRAALLTQLASAGTLLGEPARFSAAAEQAQKAADEQMELAKNAANAALEQASQGSGPQNAALKTNLMALLAAFEGREESGLGAATLGGATAGGAGLGTGAGAAGGFESPEAALEFLNGADWTNPATVRSAAGIYRAGSPVGKQFLTIVRQFAEDGAELSAAVAEKFGTRGLINLGGGPLGDAEWTSLTLGTVEETRATLLPDQPGGQPIPLVKAAGRWFIDLDGAIEQVPPQARQQIEAMAGALGGAPPAAMQQMRQMFREVYADLARRVRAGEFSSPEEVHAAMQQAMMQKVMGGMPQLPGQ